MITTATVFVTVNDAALVAIPILLAVTTMSLPAAPVGQAYSQTLAASGGTAPYAWSIASGSLPVGLTLSAAGAITGTPTTAGTAAFVVQVTDAATPPQSIKAPLSITVGAQLSITTASVPAGAVGQAYSATLAAGGGTTPYTWTLSKGPLPSGLTLSSTGTISGTPKATANNVSFTVQVSDSSTPAEIATKVYTITIAARLVIKPGSLPKATANTAYSATLSATGGTAPYQWTVTTGTLPPGLTLSSAGTLSGIPTTGGAYSFIVQATDASTPAAVGTITYNMTVAVVVAIKPGSPLPKATSHKAYSATFSATGGTAPYKWTVTTGALPTGLVLSSGGILSGIPTTAGTYTFIVQATDSSTPAAVATKAYVLKVS